VDDLFVAAGRRLGEGLHKIYRRARAEADSRERIVRRIAKLEIYVLSQHAETAKALEALAEAETEALQPQHGGDRTPKQLRGAGSSFGVRARWRLVRL
jgi:dihydroorotase-like cyclic amidohydrolase